jgi:hypothetical protein
MYIYVLEEFSYSLSKVLYEEITYFTDCILIQCISTPRELYLEEGSSRDIFLYSRHQAVINMHPDMFAVEYHNIQQMGKW